MRDTKLQHRILEQLGGSDHCLGDGDIVTLGRIDEV